MGRNSKTSGAGNSSNGTLLQQILRENHYSSTDADPYTFIKAPAFAAEDWNETTWLELLMRIEILSSQGEMLLRDLKERLGEQPEWRC